MDEWTQLMPSNIILSDIDEDPPSEINVNLETNEQYILVSTT